MKNKKGEICKNMKKYKHYYLTSESVTEGHPDKVADLISDVEKNDQLGCEWIFQSHLLPAYDEFHNQ